MTTTAIRDIARRLTAQGAWLAVAESCTGGLLAKQLTDLPGSSAWFDRGVVTYANRAKQQLLGVPAALLQRDGAVSEACARAMAAGLRRRARVQWTVAITGVAGPGGGTAAKPVGRVWIAWAGPGGIEARRFRFRGGRSAIRAAAARAAIAGLRARLLRGG
ncbi:MAG TPA: CinA family protein [Candidatus Binatia bacterium]|nr:CinA family protein [Candidatus Binatia bacterium]